jgi:hypothetical protein
MSLEFDGITFPSAEACAGGVSQECAQEGVR